MSSPRILLHLGLPKTATSSLQHNVFQPLHEQARVNFLGKCLDYDYKTGGIEVFNYSGKFIRDAVEGSLSIQEARQKLNSSLHRTLLNIFSDEGLMIAYPGKENLSLSKKFERLNAIFEGYNVKVVVTLRDPVDYLYSLYVQLYPDFCAKVKDINSIEKYVDKLIKTPNDTLFESFFYDRWLQKVPSNFELTILKYEQISQRAQCFYEEWARLLGLSTMEFQGYFDSKRMNVKIKSGKEVAKVKDFKFLERFFRELFSSSKIIFFPVRVLYRISGLKVILNYRFGSNATHAFPVGQRMMCLQEVLKVKDGFYES
ncbi:sulfotransferase domain-containing protein [Marinobacter sp. LV10MA510-1]|uniref:sulfotransferase domain-containing protein n=1 Tax=Marinobacter sp. LV10MA510-1 TaxID=1415567 RepID=UPI000BF33822|nr:sulfotransferase domain-containing protein [Marinobacter sp. LV10MA510-1]PFG09275.1 sulfotransferase domain-containing protein [Marinobacter sp. LV10MA510-1]